MKYTINSHYCRNNYQLNNENKENKCLHNIILYFCAEMVIKTGISIMAIFEYMGIYILAKYVSKPKICLKGEGARMFKITDMIQILRYLPNSKLVRLALI